MMKAQTKDPKGGLTAARRKEFARKECAPAARSQKAD
jgi:hypothetical protein